MTRYVQAGGMDVPPARDFLLSAGFAGTVVGIAAVVVLCAVLYGVRRAGKRHQAEREQRERHHEDWQITAAVDQCWKRWWQVVEAAALEPAVSEGATLGLGPDVALQLLRGLLRDAEELGAETLTNAIAAHQEQLLLVLAQQGGPLSELSTTPATTATETSPAPDTDTTSGTASRRGPKASSAAKPAPAPVEDGDKTAGSKHRL